ncbi:MAG: class 3 adenylate cyclase [Saprospiraceae bacterium]|jgi:class 3 adenylate cyclase
MELIQKSLFSPVPEKLWKRLLWQLRVENSKRIFMISIIGLFFFFLFCGLDYIRYTDGKIQPWNLSFFLFLNHLTFAFFIFPIFTIRRNQNAFDVGRFKHGRFFIYAWTIFLGVILLTMAILSLLERGDLSLYFIYIIIVNFGLIMLHYDRILLNLASFIVITIAIITLDHQNLELLIIHLMESLGVTVVSFLVSTHIFNTYVWKILTYKLIAKKNKTLAKEKKRGDQLLNNILPKEIASELMQTGTVIPRHYSSATIMMIDFKNFSGISKAITPEQLITDLDYCFTEFDEISERFRLEKIKTIGDAYLCVGGVPTSNTRHPFDCIEAAKVMIAFLNKWNEKRILKYQPVFEGRFGIHTGPVIAGVVGGKKFVFDIWGDAVNICAGMEKSGEVGKINISQTTFNLVKTIYECTHRGKIEIKNNEPIDMYFVEDV